MLVKFFTHGKTNSGRRTTGGNSAQRYLLGTADKPRQGAKVLQGDPDTTTEIINGLNFSKVYTSGVLAFAKDERKLSDKEKLDIIASFERTLFTGLEHGQYSGYWVEHSDKDRQELHFVFANVELTTGKALPVYYHKADLKLVNTWKDLTNNEYGLANPNDPARKRAFQPSEALTKTGKAADKDQINNFIIQAVDSGLVRDRETLIGYLVECGFEISRQSKDSISIKNPDGGRNIKLKGAIYNEQYNATQQITRNVGQSNPSSKPSSSTDGARTGASNTDNQRQSESTNNKLKNELDRLTAKRGERFRERYKQQANGADHRKSPTNEPRVYPAHQSVHREQTESNKRFEGDTYQHRVFNGSRDQQKQKQHSGLQQPNSKNNSSRIQSGAITHEKANTGGNTEFERILVGRHSSNEEAVYHQQATIRTGIERNHPISPIQESKNQGIWNRAGSSDSTDVFNGFPHTNKGIKHEHNRNHQHRINQIGKRFAGLGEAGASDFSQECHASLTRLSEQSRSPAITSHATANRPATPPSQPSPSQIRPRIEQSQDLNQQFASTLHRMRAITGDRQSPADTHSRDLGQLNQRGDQRGDIITASLGRITASQSQHNARLADQSQRFGATTSRIGQTTASLAGRNSQLANDTQTAIATFSQRYETAKKEMLDMARQGQLQHQETGNRVTADEMQGYIDRHPNDLAGYAMLKMTLGDLKRDRKRGYSP